MKVAIISNPCQNDPSFIANVNFIQSSLARAAIECVTFFSDQILFHEVELPKIIIFLDKDLLLGRILQQRGHYLINSWQAIALCDDKALTDLTLKDKVRQLPTLIAPLIYPHYQTPDLSFLDEAIKALGLPLILKETHGSFGRQVHLIKSKEEALALIPTLNGRRFILQKLADNQGIDYRLHVIDQEVVAAIKRVAPAGSVIANLTSGGQGFPHQPTKEEIAMALTATKELSLFTAGVDLIYDGDELCLLEVNSNARIEKVSKVAGINIADKLATAIRRIAHTFPELE